MPVVFIHRGWPKYLELAIKCVRRHYDKEIILVSDQDCIPNINVDVELVSIDDFSHGFEVMPSVFRVDGVKNLSFETSCFRRFIILFNVMNEKKLESAIYLDSDLLISGTILSTFEENLSQGIPTFISDHSTYFSGWSISFLATFIENFGSFLHKSKFLNVQNNDMECLNYLLSVKMTKSSFHVLKNQLPAYKNNNTETCSLVYYLMQHSKIWDWEKISCVNQNIDDIIEWKGTSPYYDSLNLDFIHLHGFTKKYADYFAGRFDVKITSAQNNFWW